MKAKIVLIGLLFCALIIEAQPRNGSNMFCNPINLSYRFCLDKPSRREAADPSIVVFKGKYFLFASKSGGYYVSENLTDWKLISNHGLPVIENYAPTAMVLGDWLYFMASTNYQNSQTCIYRTRDPETGKWELVNDKFPIKMTDPFLFCDDDKRVYLYFGCSNVNPLAVTELDTLNRLNPKGNWINLFGGNPKEHGWEQTGDYNTQTDAPWIEGAWLNKFKGKYYLQYAGPGTEYKSYSDGVYVSDKPTGPFAYALHNPFSSKPEGFIAGAGHGTTFTDKYGNYWHIATMSISVKHNFERRLGLFPTFFDKDGNLYSYTGFGDYPIKMPAKKISDPSELIPGSMLLSFNKKVSVSSSLEGFPAGNAVNEDIRTYWSAKTGNKGEWLSVDLGQNYSIHSIQVNFAEHLTDLYGREGVSPHKYVIEYSVDGKKWKKILDNSTNQNDLTHNFIELKKPVKGKFVRITNHSVPSSTFALSGLRVFGLGKGEKPLSPADFTVTRDKTDRRRATLSWKHDQNVTGYNIRYGSKEDQLYSNYMVYSKNSLNINSLNTGSEYWFAIDAFNENGVTNGTTIIHIE